MNRPDNLFEAASYDLLRFRERRLANRRLTPRAGPDRRVGAHPDALPSSLPSSAENSAIGDDPDIPGRSAGHA